jgi:hypothetical protein
MKDQSRSGFFQFITVITVTFLSQQAWAWGPDGHRVVGALALDQLNKQTRQSLTEIMGSSEQATLVEWCNWPDLYRATDEGAWTTPKHYINMVPGASEYEMERDCADGMCVTESIGEYASKLTDKELAIEIRRQAFGWVCHLVGDLHQPLHAGFGHDRGGNDVAVEFNGESINLHWFWDGALISDRSSGWTDLYLSLSSRSQATAPSAWKAGLEASWTNESHAIADARSYPENPVITTGFADQSWELAQDQLNKGGIRLAGVLNTVLGKQCHHSH